MKTETTLDLTRRLRWLKLSATLLAGSLTLTAPAAAQSPIAGVGVLFDWNVAMPSSGTLSSYTYNPTTDSYYVVTFGNFAGVHTLTRATTGDPYEPGVGVTIGTDAFPSDLLRFTRSSNVPGGITHTNYTGTNLLSGVLLNPTALTITVPAADASGLPTGGTVDLVYQPGELAYITDGGTHVANGGTTFFEHTKKMYRWDLRGVRTPTTDQPDFSTGTSGAAPPNENPGGAFGAVGQADWNDVFTVVMTEQEMRSAYTTATGNAMPATSQDNFGRQPAWSTSGQHLYAVDSGNTGGGIYKINAGTGAAQLIYSEDNNALGSNLISEPAVLHTSVRNLGAGFGAGDQILFDGSAAGGNAGGMNYLVDNGAAISAPVTLFTGAQLSAYTSMTASGIDSIATDSVGNIYFYDGGSQGLHVLDSAGRFRSVLNRAQLFEVNFDHDGARANGGTTVRLQVREDGPYTALTYRGDNKYVGAVRIFEGGDINRDGAVNDTDKSFFMEQFNQTYHFGAPNPAGGDGSTTSDYIDYINADLNGDIRPLGNSALPGYAAGNTGGVDLEDLDVASQFIDLELGDFNWDGTALGNDDWSIFNAHFDIDPGVFGWDDYSWFDGDVSGTTPGVPDGFVNQFDLDYLFANAPAAVPEPGSLAAMIVALTIGAGAAVRQRRKRSSR